MFMKHSKIVYEPPSVHPYSAASMASFWGFAKMSENGQNCVSPCFPGYMGLG